MNGHPAGGTGPVAIVFYATLAVWVVFELGLGVRDGLRGKGKTGRDRGTRALLQLAFQGAVLIALIAVADVRSLDIPGPHGVLGLLVIWAGLAVRIWAVVTLGASFRTTVEVDAGQPVVSSGPYRWIRHPSYTGLLLILAGFGLGIGNWLSLAVCLLLPFPVVMRRIRVEEGELGLVLGEPYRAYQAQTKRLVPRVW